MRKGLPKKRSVKSQDSVPVLENLKSSDTMYSINSSTSIKSLNSLMILIDIYIYHMPYSMSKMVTIIHTVAVMNVVTKLAAHWHEITLPFGLNIKHLHHRTKKPSQTTMWMFPKIVVPPKSSISIGFFIINHPFWGTPIFGKTHVYIRIYHIPMKS